MLAKSFVMRVTLLVLGLATAGCPSTDDPVGDTLCGNGVLNPGEQCDDANRIDHDGCSATCQVEGFCGNAEVEPGEECDDGNFTAGDGCDAECNTEVGCGDGRLQAGEQCDDDNVRDGDGCSATCMDEEPGAVCGNGIHELGEGCDDGNLEAGDGCTADCKREDGCGNGVVEGEEMCDDGNNVAGDGCSEICRVEFVCGNSYCEEQNYETCTLCPQDCCPDCGDGVLDEGEECDDGNNDNDDGCDKGCGDEDGVATCGNGIWEAGEECEDGNVTIHDGCSDVCELEFVCGDQLCEDTMGENCQRCQQDCCPNCGNGVFEPTEGEECDNTDLGGQTCTTYGCSGGTLACTSYCTLDYTGCTGSQPTCGNNTAECFEACDASDLRGKDCNGLGYDGGSLGCDSSCTYDVSGCGALLWYFWDDFEDSGTITNWSLGGIWDYGAPTYSGGPTAAYSGLNVIGTAVGGQYTNSCTYEANRAETPSIDLSVASQPTLHFYMWVNTESSFDCGALFIDTGTGFQHVANPTPAYNGNEGGYDCWEGSSISAWQEVTVDLSAYVGNTIQLGFGFYSDGSVTYAGWYLDDVLVAEASAIP